MRVKEFIYGKRAKIDCDKVTAIDTDGATFVTIMLDGGNFVNFYAESVSREWCEEVYKDISREVWGK